VLLLPLLLRVQHNLLPAGAAGAWHWPWVAVNNHAPVNRGACPCIVSINTSLSLSCRCCCCCLHTSPLFLLLLLLLLLRCCAWGLCGDAGALLLALLAPQHDVVAYGQQLCHADRESVQLVVNVEGVTKPEGEHSSSNGGIVSTLP
jgi:hypothetical protein